MNLGVTANLFIISLVADIDCAEDGKNTLIENSFLSEGFSGFSEFCFVYQKRAMLILCISQFQLFQFVRGRYFVLCTLLWFH